MRLHQREPDEVADKASAHPDREDGSHNHICPPFCAVARTECHLCHGGAMKEARNVRWGARGRATPVLHESPQNPLMQGFAVDLEVGVASAKRRTCVGHGCGLWRNEWCARCECEGGVKDWACASAVAVWFEMRSRIKSGTASGAQMVGWV